MEKVIARFAEILANNIGNKLTPELANGLLFALGNIAKAEEPKQEDQNG